MSTARELLTGALRVLNVVSTNEEPSADDMNIALESFNQLLDGMSNELLNIHTVTPVQFPLVAGKAAYTLGPGGDWETVRPMRIEQSKLMLNPVITPGLAPSQLWHFDEGGVLDGGGGI